MHIQVIRTRQMFLGRGCRGRGIGTRRSLQVTGLLRRLSPRLEYLRILIPYVIDEPQRPLPCARRKHRRAKYDDEFFVDFSGHSLPFSFCCRPWEHSQRPVGQ
jgi:hypothetical protein